MVRSTRRRPCSISPRAPAATACTSALPVTVASTGPASTGRSQALAHSRLSNGIAAPPPTRWMTAASMPAAISMLWSVVRHFSASESRIVRVNSAGVAGAGCPDSRHAAAMRPGMSPAVANRGSSGSTTLRPAGTCSAAATRSAASSVMPCCAHRRRHSSSSQRPVTFLRSRTVFSAPSSFVTFARSAELEVTGVGTLASDQRPGPARDVHGRPVRAQRGTRNGARRVVTRRGYKVDAVDSGADILDRTERRTRLVQGREDVRTKAGRGDELVAPSSLFDVEQLRRARVRDLVARAAAQQVVEQVGDHQEAARGQVVGGLAPRRADRSC